MKQKSDHIIAAGLGVEFTIIMCFGFFGGRWLDNKLDTSPVYLLVCCGAAFALAIYILIVSAKVAVKKVVLSNNENTDVRK
jgi:hypothetical protein